MVKSILQNTLRIATFNIHKGFTHFNARFSLHLQRDMLRKLQADVIFLQEVQDVHTKHTERFASMSTSGQMEFLADEVWSDYSYGKIQFTLLAIMVMRCSQNSRL